MRRTLAVLVTAASVIGSLAAHGPASADNPDLPGAADPAAPTQTLVYQPDAATLSALTFPDGEQTTLQAPPAKASVVALSYEGAWVAWLNYGGGPIPSTHLLARPTSANTEAVNVLARYPSKFTFVDTVAWAPGAHKLAFTAYGRAHAGVFGLWTIKRNGRGLKKVASDVGYCPDSCGRIIWAPDGKSVAWFAEDATSKFTAGWHRLRLRDGRVTHLPVGFFGWSDNMRWIGRSPAYSSRIILEHPDGTHRTTLKGPPPSGMGGWAPEIYFGAGTWIGYQTDEEDDHGDPADRYVAVNFTTSQVVTLLPSDPTRGGPFAFR